MIYIKSLSFFLLTLLVACTNTNSSKNDFSDSTSAEAVESGRGEAALTDYAKTLPLNTIKLPT